MRIQTHQTSIFDTQVDTKKIFVPMKHKFYLHNYEDKKGKSRLYIKLSHAAEIPKRIPQAIYVTRKFWDADNERTSIKDPEHESVNLILDNIEKKITTIKTHFFLNEKFMSLENFIKEFETGTERLDFCLFMKNEIEMQFDDGRIKFNTRKKERSVCKKLMEWRKTILFQELTEEVINKFVLHRRKTLTKTSVNSNLKIIKKYLLDAVDKGIRMPIKINKIKIGSTDGNKESLTEIELKKLKTYFESEFLKDTHKVPLANFLLGCSTGLRISDVQALSESNFRNQMIIVNSEVKTEKYHKIDMNFYAKKVLEIAPEILNVKISDQYTNRLLKEICLMLGIHRKVTFHHSRHTFATRVLRKGGTPEVLQKMLNHSTITQSMNYVTILQEDQNRQIQLLDD